jgi:transposase
MERPSWDQLPRLATIVVAGSGRGSKAGSFLEKLTVVYVYAKVIHVILDNYGIHSSTVIAIALANFARRVRLHFLPPYCPDYNRIERVWQDLHAHVTRNHQCGRMTELMCEVRYYLRKRNRWSLGKTVVNSAA